MIDLRTFCTLQDAVRVGDIIYLPHEPLPHEFAGANGALKTHLAQLPRELAERIKSEENSMLIQMFLESEAGSEGGYMRAQPTWTMALPSVYRRSAARSWALHALDDPINVPSFPFSGLGGYVVDLDAHGLLGRAFQLYGLGRLQGIRQLGWLTTPFFSDAERSTVPLRFDHTRLTHVFDVAAIANLLAASVGLSSSDTATLVLAAITHDARTPAGGDTTKLLDPDFFDEDLHYAQLLEQPGIAVLLADATIDRERLVSTAQGEGYLGRLLDIADKTAYVSRDAWWYHRRFGNNMSETAEGTQIHSLLRTHARDACSAWQSVVRVGNEIAFTDPDALGRFLLLRALLFRTLYWHPAARFTEFIVAHVICRHLYETGVVSREQLLTWTDAELDACIDPYRLTWFSEMFGTPRCEGFDTAPAAEHRRQALLEQGERFVLIEHWPRRLKTGTSFSVADGTGSLRPFSVVAPDVAAAIESVAEVQYPHRLYWVPEDAVPPRLIKLLAP